MAIYLEACLDEDPRDGSLILAALNDISRARGMSQLARVPGSPMKAFTEPWVRTATRSSPR